MYVLLLLDKTFYKCKLDSFSCGVVELFSIFADFLFNGLRNLKLPITAVGLPNSSFSLVFASYIVKLSFGSQVLSSQWINPFCHYVIFLFAHSNFLALNSTLSNTSVATQVSF